MSAMETCKMIPASEVRKECFKSPSFRKAYDALEEGFALVRAEIEARIKESTKQKPKAKTAKN